MKTLLIVNDALYGSVRTFNGAPLAGALSKQEGRDRRIFHIDAAAAADHVKQKVPAGVYNLEAMLSSMVNHAGAIDVCGTCMDAAGIAAESLIGGLHRSTVDKLKREDIWADEVFVF